MMTFQQVRERILVKILASDWLEVAYKGAARWERGNLRLGLGGVTCRTLFFQIWVGGFVNVFIFN